MDAKKFLAKAKITQGQLVRVTKAGAEYVGTVMPSGQKKGSIVRLKLKSGYNVGIAIDDKTKVEKLEGSQQAAKAGKAQREPLAQKQGQPKIMILHIGGTIASRVDYRTGAVTAAFEPEDLLQMFPELSEIANFGTKKIAQIASENMRIGHYELIAREVAKAAADPQVKGILLPHGTDTMHYTSAALAFMLENINLPVILVGAQRSSDRASSDAAMNLICASEFIAKTDFAGVAICMHEGLDDENCVILPACKTRKMHSSRRDAFKAVNDTPIARINFEGRKIEFLKKGYQKQGPSKKFRLYGKMDPKVGLIKTHTNMQPEEFGYILKQKYRGLVIEGTGLGHTEIVVSDKLSRPNEKIFKTIKKICSSGTIVAMATQTIFGRVQMHVYSPGTYLLDLGVIPCEDMTAETAFIKLSWLLGNFPKKQARELMGKNLRGEISDFTKFINGK
ncbi:MAG TPA: Glu-tRNA(Gln) amidotransferase subunit GatD [Candidatus Diapherotrites archaeon]|uniref:Glutamyl-tRNA(Gln) amidotransferase subunit D n=1 Tax=Candidatus Iainarchaeum sp. TaxID=3101447 RepID=A0A7J4IZ72_9ARCH|nr:Glu-tRNA(Gln) amidotransferase subunit GatD [Candidatus Diapherotrites archaeon]